MTSLAALNNNANTPEETPHQIFIDSIRLIGSTTVAGTCYGMMSVTAGACVHTLFRFRRRRTVRRLAFLIGYVATLWVCGTLFVAGLSRAIQNAYVDHRLFMPSPGAYFDWSQPGAVIADAAYTCAIILSDGLMVWRFKVIWYDSAWFNWIMPIPAFLYLASAVLCLISTVDTSIPGHGFYSDVAHRTTVPGFILPMVLNVFTTSCMAGRLYYYRRRLAQSVGPDDPNPKIYTNVAAMLIESCALYTSCSVISIILYLLHSSGEFPMITVLAQVQIIAPLLVLLRIARGIAWDETAVTTVTTGVTGPERAVKFDVAVEDNAESGYASSGRLCGGMFEKYEIQSVIGGVVKADELLDGEV
ncbi:hypothetical protein CONPUDRAFT_166725 [Coniophora puteana RWD-64-598 SS2]|uniref:Uncharacterized protein n=1 Tax=Coniophora puteana (strain RWD-64-598) TaxID=741705 RepID=A0A5M3MIF3_CONPW|nr:uncharacterized protein CONPUDRAFT_166725 [Coniophora puteana RWD-64-598 SS2]EIW78827.1 hypothetical protein CONPUDRAFT_166725 [Coniophora puteana RWD-64-598 SS2]